MNTTVIESALVEVLQTIQATSDLDCPPLLGTTKPIEELPKFDSKIWPVAIGILGAKLGVTIANDVNIFCDEDSTTALTIDQITLKVSQLVQEQDESEDSKQAKVQ
jgi:hypothetical protein